VIYIRDDLDGYVGWVDTGVPRNAGIEAHRTAVLNAHTLTTVILTYHQGDAPGLQSVAITHPQPLVPIDDPDPDGATLIQPFPKIARRSLSVMLMALTTGMTESQVHAAIRDTDPEHYPGVLSALTSLKQSVGMQWYGDLDADTDRPSRPTLTLDRDREVMPDPDPDQVAQDRATIAADLAAIDALYAMVATAIETAQASVPMPGEVRQQVATDIEKAEAIVPMPGVVRQQTAWAVDLVGQAVTDAPSGRGWTQNDQAGLDMHRRPGNTGRITLGGDRQLRDFALAAMREAMQKTDSHVLPLLYILITLARKAVDDEKGGIVTIHLDALARRLYGRSRGPVESAERRASLWDQVRFIASLRVEGPGPRMKIRDYGKLVGMAWFHPLIVIEGVLATITEQIALDGLHPAPAVIKIRASDRLASNARLGDRALPVLGELSRVMMIPAGKPGGSWARAITHALVFEARKLSNSTVDVTREYLLTHYPGDPHPMDLLDDPKSSRRAVEYWKGALKVISRDLPGLIEHIEDPEVPTGHGWADQWLKQEVLIRLGPDAPEMVGLRNLIAGKDTHAMEKASRQDRDTIEAEKIRIRRAKTAPPGLTAP